MDHPNRTRIKICGIRDIPAVQAAVDAGADAVGMVFVPGTPRAVTIQDAEPIVRALPAFVQTVGLFVDEPASRIRQVADSLGLSMVQLHGHETPDDVAALAPLRVIKSIAFNAEVINDTLAAWQSPPSNLAGLLFDAAPPSPTAGNTDGKPDSKQNSNATGGHGRAFDWQALADLMMSSATLANSPIILAGGLTPANVGRAIGVVRPFAVDVSSGVEIHRGEKDHTKIHAFCKAVRQADDVA